MANNRGVNRWPLQYGRLRVKPQTEPLSLTAKAISPTTGAEELVALTRNSQPTKVRAAIVSNPNLPHSLAEEYSHDPSIKVLRALAVHTSFQDVLSELASLNNPSVLVAVVNNAATNPNLLSKIYTENKGNTSIVEALAKNPKLDKKYHHEIFLENTNEETLKQLVIQAKKRLSNILSLEEVKGLPVQKQTIIAGNTFVVDFMTFLSSSQELGVLKALLNNPNITPEIWTQTLCQLSGVFEETNHNDNVLVFDIFNFARSFDFTNEQYNRVLALKNPTFHRLISMASSSSSSINIPVELYRYLPWRRKTEVLFYSWEWTNKYPSILLVECFNENKYVRTVARNIWASRYAGNSLNDYATFKKYLPEDFKEVIVDGVPLEWIILSITNYYADPEMN